MDSKIDIQKLLQLKRQEAEPPSDFPENFLTEFQRRQRIDFLQRTLKPSLRKTFVERMPSSLATLHVPFWAYGVIAAVGLLLSFAIWFCFPVTEGESSTTLTNSKKYGSEHFSLKPPVKIPSQRQAVDILDFPNRYPLEERSVGLKK